MNTEFNGVILKKITDNPKFVELLVENEKGVIYPISVGKGEKKPKTEYLKEGQILDIKVFIHAKEYNGRYFVNLYADYIKGASTGQSKARGQSIPETDLTTSNGDDLPF